MIEILFAVFPPFLISKEAYARVRKQVEARPCSPLHVKGKSQTVDVYELVGLK